jgi:hypothetical protein
MIHSRFTTTILPPPLSWQPMPRDWPVPVGQHSTPLRRQSSCELAMASPAEPSMNPAIAATTVRFMRHGILVPKWGEING